VSKQVINLEFGANNDTPQLTLTWRTNNAISLWLQGTRSKTWTNGAAATWAGNWIGFTTSLFAPWRMRTG